MVTKIIVLFLICSSAFAKDISLKTIGSEVYYVPVTIENITRDFLLDTGAGHSAINKQILKELKNAKFQGYIIGILANNQKIKLKVYKIFLNIGQCGKIEVEAVILPNNTRPIIGLSALKELSTMTIDFNNKKLSFKECK